jgi:hypothetical protein
MSPSNLSSRIRHERVRDRSLRAFAALFVGVILIAAGIILAFGDWRASTRERPNLPPPLALSSTPVASISAPPSDAVKSPAPGKQIAPDPGELGQTLEEFQAEYESLSGKDGGEEAFFKNSVGKKVAWTVRVDRVFRAGTGVIVVFSSNERPDWAAFPISDARFPVRLEEQLTRLSRGDVIKIEGKIAYLGIKTLECSSFEVVSSDAQDHAR